MSVFVLRLEDHPNLHVDSGIKIEIDDDLKYAISNSINRFISEEKNLLLLAECPFLSSIPIKPDKGYVAQLINRENGEQKKYIDFFIAPFTARSDIPVVVLRLTIDELKDLFISGEKILGRINCRSIPFRNSIEIFSENTYD